MTRMAIRVPQMTKALSRFVHHIATVTCAVAQTLRPSERPSAHRGVAAPKTSRFIQCPPRLPPGSRSQHSTGMVAHWTWCALLALSVCIGECGAQSEKTPPPKPPPSRAEKRVVLSPERGSFFLIGCQICAFWLLHDRKRAHVSTHLCTSILRRLSKCKREPTRISRHNVPPARPNPFCAAQVRRQLESMKAIAWADDDNADDGGFSDGFESLFNSLRDEYIVEELKAADHRKAKAQLWSDDEEEDEAV